MFLILVDFILHEFSLNGTGFPSYMVNDGRVYCRVKKGIDERENEGKERKKEGEKKKVQVISPTWTT